MSRVNRYEYQNWKEFGARVKRYREQICMTKEKFAELINRSENYISELEKGNTSCSVHTLHQIATVLKVSIDNLLYDRNVDMQKVYNSREILQNIINRCNEDEIEVLKDIIVATFPNLEKIKEKR